jgi:hypothetical protein
VQQIQEPVRPGQPVNAYNVGQLQENDEHDGKLDNFVRALEGRVKQASGNHIDVQDDHQRQHG